MKTGINTKFSNGSVRNENKQIYKNSNDILIINCNNVASSDNNII